MYSHNNLYNVEYLHCKLLVMYILFHRYIYESKQFNYIFHY